MSGNAHGEIIGSLECPGPRHVGSCHGSDVEWRGYEDGECWVENRYKWWIVRWESENLCDGGEGWNDDEREKIENVWDWEQTAVFKATILLCDVAVPTASRQVVNRFVAPLLPFRRESAGR